MNKVVVLGAGVAGASTAIFLRQRGINTLLVERKPDKQTDLPVIGESLPPDAKNVLLRLGVWEKFKAGAHLQCFGNKSYWFSDKAQYHDFMQHPVGHGWHLDRATFDQMLLDHAIAMGADYHANTRIVESKLENDSWRLTLKGANRREHTETAVFVVDATGRNSWFARRQGVSRLYEDQQLALIRFHRTTEAFQESTSLVETTDEGWWYSALIPDARMVSAFFCKPDKTQREQWIRIEGWRKLLASAPHTQERLKKAGCEPLKPPHFVPADSGILEKLTGLRWLAVGDAALTYDPIASHGILMAMVTGRDAALAIARFFDSDVAAIEEYNAQCWWAFRQYSQQRMAFY